MSAGERKRSGRSRDDDAQRGGTASALSEESSSLSPASRVLAIADQVADEDEQMANGIDSEADSDDSIGPGSRYRGTIMRSGGSSDGGLRQRAELRGYVQERRGRHKQSSVQHTAVGDLPRSPAESRASSTESWRRALSSDGKGSPRSMVGKHDHGDSRAAIEEEGVLQGAAETAGLGRGVAEAVETMNVTDLKAKAAELGISTGGRKTQLKARIKQKLSARPRSSSSVAVPTAMGASDREAGNDAMPVPGSIGDTSAAATTAVSAEPPTFGDSCGSDGESVPEQEPTKSEGSTLPEESEFHDQPPLGCNATPTVEQDLAARAATLEVSSPRLLPERAGGPAPAAAASPNASPAEVVEVAALRKSSVGQEASVDPVDMKGWKGEVNVSHNPTAERVEPEELLGGGDDELCGGVEVEEVGVFLLEQGRGEEGVGTGADDDQQLVHSLSGGGAELDCSVPQQSDDMEKEEGPEITLEEQLDPQEEQEGDQGEDAGGRFSDEEDVESLGGLAAAAAAAAADVRACGGGKLAPALLFSPGSEVTGIRTKAAQSIDEQGVMAVEEDAHGGEGGEEKIMVPSAAGLNENFIQVARLWAPTLRKPDLNGARDPGVLPDILPETQALKAKIKVLSAWFHQGARNIAPSAAASSNQAASGVDDQPAQTAAGAIQVRLAVSAGSKARCGGGAKAKATSGGRGNSAGGVRRTGRDSAVRKVAGRGVGADDGGSTSTATAGGPAAPKVRPRRTSGVSVSTPGGIGIRTSGAGMKGRLGKPRAQRLSVSPPRTKLSASAAAAARMSAASCSAAALAVDARAGGRTTAPPANRKAVKAPPTATPVPAAAPPSSLKKRNPLIRGSSPPRPPRASNLGSSAEERGGGGAAGKLAGGGTAVAGDRATGTPSGQSASAIGTPARMARLRSRKASLVSGSGSGLSKSSTAPASASKVPPSKKTGFLSSSKARRTSDVRTPTAKDGTPIAGGTSGSGSRSALQVFRFDPAISTSPHARGALNASVGPGADALSPHHEPLSIRNLNESDLLAGGTDVRLSPPAQN